MRYAQSLAATTCAALQFANLHTSAHYQARVASGTTQSFATWMQPQCCTWDADMHTPACCALAASMPKARALGNRYSPHKHSSACVVYLRSNARSHTSQSSRSASRLSGMTARTARGPCVAMAAPMAACASVERSTASSEPLQTL